MEFDVDVPQEIRAIALVQSASDGHKPYACGRDSDGDWAVFYAPVVAGGISWAQKIAHG